MCGLFHLLQVRIFLPQGIKVETLQKYYKKYNFCLVAGENNGAPWTDNFLVLSHSAWITALSWPEEHSVLGSPDNKCERLLIGRVDGSVALLELDTQKQDCVELPNCSIPYGRLYH